MASNTPAEPIDLSNDVHQAAAHRPRLIRSLELRRQIYGDNPLGKFNDATARVVARVLSSMWFFWFCVLLDTVELVALIGQPFNAIAWVAFLSQTVIQLLALPVLAVMSDMQQRASDARAEADHRTLTALHTMNKTQLQILQALEKLSKEQEALLGRLSPGRP